MLNIIYILHSLSAKAQTHAEYNVFVYSLFLLVPVVEVEYTPTHAWSHFLRHCHFVFPDLFLGSSSRSLPFSRIFLHNNLK